MATPAKETNPPQPPKMLRLSIATANAEFPYQVRYPATMALVEFKVKLELVVGIYSADMRLELRSAEGKFLAELFGDDRTLEELGVTDNSTVFVHDLHSQEAGQMPTDMAGATPHYKMPDEKYESRKESARKWKQEILASKASASPASSEESVPHAVPSSLQLGVTDNSTVFVHDLHSQEAGQMPTDMAGATPHYKMPDEKYESRKESARKWKQEILASKASASPASSEESVPHAVPSSLQPGKECIVQTSGAPRRFARVAYVGPTHFGANPGKNCWVGVVYEQAVGKNDGSLDGHRYFTCEPGHGGFVQPKAVEVLEEDGCVLELEEANRNKKPDEEEMEEI